MSTATARRKRNLRVCHAVDSLDDHRLSTGQREEPQEQQGRRIGAHAWFHRARLSMRTSDGPATRVSGPDVVLDGVHTPTRSNAPATRRLQDQTTEMAMGFQDVVGFKMGSRWVGLTPSLHARGHCHSAGLHTAGYSIWMQQSSQTSELMAMLPQRASGSWEAMAGSCQSLLKIASTIAYRGLQTTGTRT